MSEIDFDILKMLPREAPKPKAKNDIFADLGEWTKRAVRTHYPELVDKLIKDE